MVLESFFNSIFGKAIEISPLFGLLLVSFIFTLIVTIIFKFATNQEFLKNSKKDLKRLGDELKEARKCPK